MTEEELEKSGLFSVIRDEEDLSIDEQIEEFEDKLDYLDIDDKEKEKLINLCKKIKEEEDSSAKEFLFDLLRKEVD